MSCSPLYSFETGFFIEPVGVCLFVCFDEANLHVSSKIVLDVLGLPMFIATIPSFYLGARNLNSGPHACAPCSLTYSPGPVECLSEGKGNKEDGDYPHVFVWYTSKDQLQPPWI